MSFFDNTLNKVIKRINEVYDVHTGIGSDRCQVDIGVYIVMFDDGEQIVVDAESKIDAKRKASQQKPGKRPVEIKLVEEGIELDFNKNEQTRSETLIIKKQLDGMYVLVDAHGNRFCAYKTPEEAEVWAKENGYGIRREFKEDQYKETDPGRYKVSFTDGSFVEIDADSRWNAIQKARGKSKLSPVEAKKVEEGIESYFNKDDKEAQIKELQSSIKVGDYVKPEKWAIGANLGKGRDPVGNWPGSKFTLAGQYGNYPVNIKITGNKLTRNGYRCNVEFVNDDEPNEFSKGWITLG